MSPSLPSVSQTQRSAIDRKLLESVSIPNNGKFKSRQRMEVMIRECKAVASSQLHEYLFTFLKKQKAFNSFHWWTHESFIHGASCTIFLRFVCLFASIFAFRRNCHQLFPFRPETRGKLINLKRFEIIILSNSLFTELNTLPIIPRTRKLPVDGLNQRRWFRFPSHECVKCHHSRWNSAIN